MSKDINLVRASDVSFNEAIFRVAAAHDREVEFRYSKGRGEVIETRVLKPNGVTHVEDDSEQGYHVTFQGYDPDRDMVRQYRLDRVKGEAKIVGRS